MAELRIRSSRPGPRAPEPFIWTVEIDEPGLRWTVVLRFANWDEREWLNVGFELRHAKIDETTDRGSVAEISPQTVERIALDYDRYLALARAELDFDYGSRQHAALRLRARGRGRRGLEPEFFQIVAAEYADCVKRGRPPGATIARLHHADESTASRWIRRAKDLGYITGEEEK